MKAHPQWIARMYPGTTGRDHLGLGEVSSGQILKSLSPSINVATIHPRYHSFYIFLLDEFWERNRPANRKAWVRFYRPREFVFSVGANLCDQPQHREMGSIVGSDKTRALARQELKQYDSTTEYIDSDLGGYGLYYRSVMAELGLLIPGGQGFPTAIDLPTERGREIAAAFRQAVAGTTYYRKYFDKDDARVPIEAIREYIRRACLCQLQTSAAPDRPLLRDVFLKEGLNPDPRRETFRLFLDIAAQTKGIPIDEDTFRQLLFFGKAPEGGTYAPSPEVASFYLRWRLYQAREYYVFALNTLWWHLCDWGEAQGGTLRPLPLRQFTEHLAEAIDFSKLVKTFDLPRPRISAKSDFRELLGWLMSLVGSDEAGFDHATGIKAPLHEHILYEAAVEDDASEILTAGMLTMLAMTYLRFGRPELWGVPEWEISTMGAEGRLSVHGFIQDVRSHLQGGPFSILDFARWIYTSYVILQHQLVATRKLPENTFRFRRQGDRLQFYKLYNPLGFNDSRFSAITTHIHELGLCGTWSSVSHAPTPDGRKLLRQGNLG